MKELVDEMQSGFIKDRSITGNFATAIEMIQCSNRLKRPIIVLKLDFQKAFDSVHWEAITATLRARNFPDRWIWWIRHLLETFMAQILVNSQVGKKFKIEKGVRQGDPLSPLPIHIGCRCSTTDGQKSIWKWPSAAPTGKWCPSTCLAICR
jgi:hypothetical protein